MWSARGAAVVVILAVALFGGTAAVKGQNTNFTFNPASDSPDQDYRNILASGDVYVDTAQKAILMNAQRALDETGLSNCGRVVYKDKVRMVDKASGAVASFTTAFTFSFKSNNSVKCGSGMVFMFSAGPSLSPAQESTAGAAFCVLNYNNASSRLFAVEFDSDYNPDMFDTSDSHIGLDFRNRNFGTHNLCSSGTVNCSYFCKDGNAKYTAWMDYNSTGQTLEIRFREGNLTDGRGKPVDPVVNGSYNLALDEVRQAMDEEMYVGFVGSTGGAREVHTIWAWEFATTGMPNAAGPSGAGLVAGICAAIVGTLVLAGVSCWCWIRRRNRQVAFKGLPLYALEADVDDSRSYTFKELSIVTKNFSASELLSSGAFGDVYKGTLPSGALVAVKRIKDDKDHGGETFLAEVTSLRQTRHRNLLQLRGWSQSADGMFLVYDFMCNGSVDKWLHVDPGDVKAALAWGERRFILAGVASGLEYLHEDGVKCVLHRDIKSSNVMLDAGFKPFLGDFGLARLVDHRLRQKTTLPAGTFGYMAPEMLHTGKATKETDVYAFGILVLEVVCGRRPLEMEAVDDEDHVLVDRVWRAHEARNILQVADPRLPESVTAGGTLEEQVMMANVLHVGLLCCLPDPRERPSMRVVNQWFQSSEEAGAVMALPPLPASKPYYSHYSVPLGNSSDGTSASLTSSLVGR